MVAAAGVATAGVSAEVVAGVAAAGAGFAGSPEPSTAAATGFEASTVDVLVAIAAAAIASGWVVLPGDAGATIASVAAAGTAIATATGAVIDADAGGCGDAARSAVAVSGVATMSEAASLTVVFTIPDFATPGFAGLLTASALPSAAACCPAPDCASCEGVFVAALEEEPLSRAWRLSDAAAASSGRGDGRSSEAGRSLPAVSAALLSISAEKLSGAGDWSARADLAGALGTDRFAVVSDVTLNTGGLSQ